MSWITCHFSEISFPAMCFHLFVSFYTEWHLCLKTSQYKKLKWKSKRLKWKDAASYIKNFAVFSKRDYLYPESENHRTTGKDLSYHGVQSIWSSIHENYQLIKSILTNTPTRVCPQTIWAILCIYLEISAEVQNRHHCLWECEIVQSRDLCLTPILKLFSSHGCFIFHWVLLPFETLLLSWTEI